MTTTLQAEASIAAQAAVEAYLAVHPAYEGSIAVVLGSGLYDAPSGVVIEHEGHLRSDAGDAAKAAVRAQGLRLDVLRWNYAWEVRLP